MSLTDSAADLVGDLAGPYVLLAQSGRSIGGIVPNVTVREVIADENVVTQNPTTLGTPVADHIFASPVTLEMLVGWSDSTGAWPGYSINIYETFQALRDSRQPFDVYTGKRMFSNMVFTSIVAATDETTENSLMLQIRMQEVIISDTDATGTGDGATSANQAFPQQTGPETNVGTVALQPYSGTLPYFATAGAAGLPTPNST